MQKRRRIIVVPQRVGKVQKYALAVQIESRSGLMHKVVHGMLLFTTEELEKAKRTCNSLGPVVDLRLKGESNV